MRASDVSVLLRECRSLTQAKRLHSIVDENPCTYLWNLVIQMYGNCGSVSDACRVFEELGEPGRNVFTWTIMFTAYAQNGHLLQARVLFDSMPERNVVSWNSMIVCYARFGSLCEGRKVFDRMPSRTLPTWNAMISGYTQNDEALPALNLYRCMDLEGIRGDKITNLSAVNACATLQSDSNVALVKIVESGCESDVSVGNSLITMYCKCGDVVGAQNAFDKIDEPNVVSWTALLAAYAQNRHLQQAAVVFQQMPVRNEVSWTAIITAHTQCGSFTEALILFRRMDLDGHIPDRVTFTSAIDAAASLGETRMGILLHSEMISSGIEQDLAVGNTLVSMYGRFNLLQEAGKTFDSMPARNVVTWTAVVSANAQNGALSQAREFFDRMPERCLVTWNAMISGYSDGFSTIDLFRIMRLEGIPPDRITFIAALEACSSLTDARLGRGIHSQIKELGLESDICVATAMLNMYSKCGCLEQAGEVFGSIPAPDVIIWSALISAHAGNGDGAGALEIFTRMQLEGVPPNSITLISVIAACSHIGMVEQGLARLGSMREDFNLEPDLEHLVCLVDVLGRSGRISEAEAVVRASGLPLIAWKSLLSYCESDPSRAGRIFELVLEPDSKSGNGASMVMLSNILASVARAEVGEEGMGGRYSEKLVKYF